MIVACNDSTETTRETRGKAVRSSDELDCSRIARYQCGDPRGFDEIVAAHQQRVTRLAYRLLGWSDDVEDIVQEVFLSVLQSLPRFRGDSRLSTWITRITVNKCRSFKRRRVLRLRSLPRLVEDARRKFTVTTETKSTSRHAEIRDAVRSLPQKYREPIVLRYFEELSVAEVADALGLTAGAVEVRLSRARGRLKVKLSKEFRGI